MLAQSQTPQLLHHVTNIKGEGFAFLSTTVLLLWIHFLLWGIKVLGEHRRDT